MLERLSPAQPTPVESAEVLAEEDQWLIPRVEFEQLLPPVIIGKIEKYRQMYNLEAAQVYNLVAATACLPGRKVSADVLEFVQIQFPRSIFGWPPRQIGMAGFLYAIEDESTFLIRDALRMEQQGKSIRDIEAEAKSKFYPGLLSDELMLNRAMADPFKERIMKRYPYLYREINLIAIASYTYILTVRRGDPDFLAEYANYYHKGIKKGLKALDLGDISVKIEVEQNTLIVPMRATVAVAREWNAIVERESIPEGVAVKRLTKGRIATIDEVVDKVAGYLIRRKFIEEEVEQLGKFFETYRNVVLKVWEEIGLQNFLGSTAMLVGKVGTPGSFNHGRWDPARAQYGLLVGEGFCWPWLDLLIHELTQMMVEAAAAKYVPIPSYAGKGRLAFPITGWPKILWSDIEGATVAITEEAMARIRTEMARRGTTDKLDSVRCMHLSYASGVPNWRNLLFRQQIPITGLLRKLSTDPELVASPQGPRDVEKRLITVWGIRESLRRYPAILARDIGHEVAARPLTAYMEAMIWA